MKLRIQTCKRAELTRVGISTPVLLSGHKEERRERESKGKLCPSPTFIQSRERCFLTFK